MFLLATTVQKKNILMWIVKAVKLRSITRFWQPSSVLNLNVYSHEVKKVQWQQQLRIQKVRPKHYYQHSHMAQTYCIVIFPVYGVYTLG